MSVAITTEYDFNSDSGSYGVHNSITVTISVAVGATCSFNFDSHSCGVYNSITVTISVAVQAICNFNFGSIAAVFTMQSQLQYQ